MNNSVQQPDCQLSEQQTLELEAQVVSFILRHPTAAHETADLTFEQPFHDSIIQSVMRMPPGTLDVMAHVAAELAGKVVLEDVKPEMLNAEDLNEALKQRYPVSLGGRTGFYTARDQLIKSKQVKACLKALTESQMKVISMNNSMTMPEFSSNLSAVANHVDAKLRDIICIDPIEINPIFPGSSGTPWERLDIKPPQRVKTGVSEIDFLLDGGLPKGELTVVSARPGGCKSALALWLAGKIATGEQPSSVMYMSMEMGNAQVRRRLLGGLTGIPFKEIGALGGSQQAKQAFDERMTPSMKQRLQQNFNLFDRSSWSVSDMRAAYHKCAARSPGGKVDAVFIDYVQLMSPTTEKAADKYNALGDIVKELKRFAIAFDCAVFIVSQLNRRCEEGNRPPILADLAESDMLGKHSYIVIMIDKEELEKPSAITPVTLRLAKNRDGNPGKECYLDFTGPSMGFNSRSRTQI